MLVDGVHPGLHILEALLIGDVEGNDHAVGLSVELVGNRLKTLLPSSIPNLYVESLLPLFVIRLNKVNTLKQSLKGN